MERRSGMNGDRRKKVRDLGVRILFWEKAAAASSATIFPANTDPVASKIKPGGDKEN
jgi:hypothetical protein